MWEGSSAEKRKKKVLCVFSSPPGNVPPTDWDRITIFQELGSPHADYFFSNKFTAVYSSYRQIYIHNKKSTTIFIKLEVRWAGKRGKHILEWIPKPLLELVSKWNDLDTTLPAGRALPEEELQSAGSCAVLLPMPSSLCSPLPLFISQMAFWELPLSPVSSSVQSYIIKWRGGILWVAAFSVGAGMLDWGLQKPEGKKSFSCPRQLLHKLIIIS
jgi:hypothetical protein